MFRYNLIQRSQNQDFLLRRSEILSDCVIDLPKEITTIIFSKMEDDPKTLTRCYAVSKNWASVVSQTVNLSFRMSCTGDKGHSIPCSELHYHVPVSAIPGMMRLFANLESVEIKLCHCPSRTPYPACNQHVTKVKAEWAVDHASQTYTCTANEVGLLSTVKGPMVALELDEENFDTVENSPAMELYWRMLCCRPDTLRSLSIVSAKTVDFNSEGKIFISYDQLSNFPDSILELRVNKSWLEDPKNVVYWHKDQRNKEHSLREKVWLFYQWHSLISEKQKNVNDLTEKKEDLMKLLDELDDGDDKGTKKPGSQN
ncbi:unnamed protein product [Dovyalis caffra]|uniref:F-box domain-containing protein n=1 Tax=Dovyalis caffra TaxID=77055 RepID=A0AAV1RTK9_9ROSI|nr:unnamed protein product [Dovyalis caffra]